jgi:hypothetical protein
MAGRGSGAIPFLNGALSDTEVLVFAGRISMASFFIYNGSNAAAFVRLYDAAAAADVTSGTTTPDYVLGSATVTWAQGCFCKPIQFTKGIVVVASTTAVGSGHTAPNVALVVNLGLNQ